MSFMEGIGQVARQKAQCAWFARVSVRLATEDGRGEVSLTEGPNRTFEPWRKAARAGAEYGLRKADARHDCVVTEVQGMVCDTNATLVAIAAARAVWDALDDAPQGASEELEGLVEVSHKEFENDELAPIFRTLSSS